MRAGFIPLLLLLLGLFWGCENVGNQESTLLTWSEPKGETSKASSAIVVKVEVKNGQLIIDGKSLAGVSEVKIQGSSFNEAFEIESNSGSRIIANGMRNISFAVGAIFDLILSDAHGAATFQVSFSLNDKSITAAKLHDMGAGDGDVLVYNQPGDIWEPRALSGVNLVGTWDASTNTPTLSNGGGTTSPLAGDYYIVNTAGTTNIDGNASWGAGDWIIYNGATWDRVVNTSDVTSFKGRQGAIIPEEGDYGIDLLSDVNTSTVAPTTGKVLKFDGTTWVAGEDLADPGANSVTSSEIADGSIVNADISATAAIAQSKIANLSTDMGAKLNLDGTNAMSGHLDMGTYNVINVGSVDGVDVSAIKIDVDANTSFIAGISKADVGLANVDNVQQMPLNYLSIDATLGGATPSDTLVSSQNAVKTYVDGKTWSAGDLPNAESLNTACALGKFLKSDGTNFTCADASGGSSLWSDNTGDIYYSSGNVGIGLNNPTVALSVVGDAKIAGNLKSEKLQVEQAGASVYPYTLLNTVSTSGFGQLIYQRARGETFGGELAVAHEDVIGTYTARAHNGTQYEDAAQIKFMVDGTNVTGSGNHPGGRIDFVVRDAADTQQYYISKTAMSISNAGEIGIGTTGPNDALDVVGDVDATGCFQNNDAGTIGGTCVSDERLKMNIQPLESSLERLLKINPVTYAWRPEFFDIHHKEGREIGLVAQEVEKVFPEMVEERADGYKRVKYDITLELRLLNALKEFFGLFQEHKKSSRAEVEKIKIENAKLKLENKKLMDKNRAIEARLLRLENIVLKTGK